MLPGTEMRLPCASWSSLVGVVPLGLLRAGFWLLFPAEPKGPGPPCQCACPRLALFIHRALPQDLPTRKLAAGEAVVVWASTQRIAWEWGPQRGRPQTLFPSALGDSRAPRDRV